MDDDTRWLRRLLGLLLPKVRFTLWRGAPPLTHTWIVVLKRKEARTSHFMLDHSIVTTRNEARLRANLRRARLALP